MSLWIPLIIEGRGEPLDSLVSWTTNPSYGSRIEENMRDWVLEKLATNLVCVRGQREKKALGAWWVYN